MTPERWQVIKELLDGALQRSPADRGPYLEQACSSDPTLRREVESLLAADPDPGGFLEPPPHKARGEADIRGRLQAAVGQTYRMEREIGRGGMSTVYLAQDIKHRRSVAIKVLHEGAATAVGVQRFQREIEVLAKLQHPNILPLYDSGVVDWALYYVMPFVEGESLRARLIREKQLPVDEALRIATEVADALGYAHTQGIVHRDIKPENILLSGGHAVVADFGIGKSMVSSGSASLTTSGSFVGTPAYVSPEQGAGERHLDGRSDLYSLGIVLFELLAGVPPFTGPTPHAVIVRRFSEAAPPVRQFRDSVPESVERALSRVLAKAPADRFRTAAEFIRALGALSDDMDASEPIGVPDGEWGGAARRRTTSAPATAMAGATPSIVVLPFANMSANPDDEYFSDGMTEEIIGALTRLRTMRVVARTSAFAFKGKAKDVRAIAQRLKVSNVLEGSVRRSGSRLRVSAELIDGSDGLRIWAEQFDRQVDDVFAVQDELARHIVESLRVTLLGGAGQAVVTPVTPNSEAYELYLKGLYYSHRRTERSLLKAISHYEEAIARDSRFALAFAGLADSYAMLCIYGEMASGEGMPRARAAAQSALEIDPSLGEAHMTSGCVKAIYHWEWAAAERDFKRALVLSPQNPATHQRYALDVLAPLGRFDEASRELEQARALDPLSLIVNTTLGLPLYFGRRYEEASDQYLKALELDPNFGIAHYFLGQTYVARGLFDEGIAAFQRALELGGPSAQASASLAHAYGVSKQSARARAALADLQMQATSRYLSPCLVALVHIGLEEHDSALDWLERAHEERAADLFWLQVRPTFDPLRREERFRTLLAQLGFTP